MVSFHIVLCIRSQWSLATHHSRSSVTGSQSTAERERGVLTCWERKKPKLNLDNLSKKMKRGEKFICQVGEIRIVNKRFSASAVAAASENKN